MKEKKMTADEVLKFLDTLYVDLGCEDCLLKSETEMLEDVE